MEFVIVESSDKASGSKTERNRASLYPFDDLDVGTSFTCKLEAVNWKSLRVCVSQRNKRNNGKKFVFIKHDNLGLCEVARIL